MQSPRSPSACPGTGSGQSSPCFQQSCTNRTRLSHKNLCDFREITVHEMGSKGMFACPAPASSSFPSTECSVQLCLPSHLSPSIPSTRDKPASGKAWLEETQPLLAASSHCHWCQGRLSARAAALHGQEAPGSIPTSQQSLAHRKSSEPPCWRAPPHGQPGLVPSHLQDTGKYP